jgi:hypothetical protein
MNQINIGSKVILIEDIEMFARTYKIGEIFTVYGSSYRGWDLVNDKGEKIDETLFSEHKYKLYNIKKERKEKLQKINDRQITNII